nr:hypothetical protein BaRGS_024973 [Batillaria attramentaria]
MMWTMNLLTALAALACVVSGEEEQVGKQGLKTFKVAVPSSTAPESDKDKRANQGDCYIPSEGIWRRHGETFTIGGNRCITYRCNYGQYNFAREACSVEGRCVQLNTEFDYGRCSRLRCVKNNRGSYVEYKFINVGNPKCEVNGVCYEFGQVFEVFCQSKRCSAEIPMAGAGVRVKSSLIG